MIKKKEYTASRDSYTVDREGLSVNKWQQTSIEHAGKINSAKGIELKMKATKIQFDWEENGRNRAKQVTDEYDREIAGRCKECGLPDSQYHAIIECITPTLTKIRIETENRIDNFIHEEENSGKNIVIHN